MQKLLSFLQDLDKLSQYVVLKNRQRQKIILDQIM